MEILMNQAQGNQTILRFNSEIIDAEQTPGIGEMLDIIPSYKTRSHKIEVVSEDGLFIGFMPYQFEHFFVAHEPWCSKCMYTGIKRVERFLDDWDDEEETESVILGAEYLIGCTQNIWLEARNFFGNFDNVSFIN